MIILLKFAFSIPQLSEHRRHSDPAFSKKEEVSLNYGVLILAWLRPETPRRARTAPVHASRAAGDAAGLATVGHAGGSSLVAGCVAPLPLAAGLPAREGLHEALDDVLEALQPGRVRPLRQANPPRPRDGAAEVPPVLHVEPAVYLLVRVAGLRRRRDESPPGGL